MSMYVTQQFLDKLATNLVIHQNTRGHGNISPS